MKKNNRVNKVYYFKKKYGGFFHAHFHKGFLIGVEEFHYERKLKVLTITIWLGVISLHWYIYKRDPEDDRVEEDLDRVVIYTDKS